MADFKVGDRVHVTEEYAAWYREHVSTLPPRVTPDTLLVIMSIGDAEARVVETVGSMTYERDIPLLLLTHIEREVSA